MALISTPGQYRDRADFYRQTTSLLSAGYGLIECLEHLRQNPPRRGYARPIGVIVEGLRDGDTLAQAIKKEGRWIPEFDAALLEAGELSGRLDSCTRQLADYYDTRARLLKSLYSSMAYPVFLLHIALVILAAPGLVLSVVQGDPSIGVRTFLMRTVGVLVPLYLIVLAVRHFSDPSRGRLIRQLMEAFMNAIPVLGGARRHLALSRLALSLESLLNAGVLVATAWPIAARSSGSFRLQRAVATWPEKIHAGSSPAELIQRHRAFPQVFANLYNTGEASGRTDEHLRRLQVYYQESGVHRMEQLATWVPRIIYLMIVVYIAVSVVQGWTNYFKMVEEFSTF